MNMKQRKQLVEFSLIWSVIFLFLGGYNVLEKNGVGWIFAAGSVLFVVIAFVNPFLLNGFYSFWVKIGEAIGGGVSKVILFILFFCVFSPIAIVLRLFGVDLLSKKINLNKSSYWVVREKQPQPMRDQF